MGLILLIISTFLKLLLAPFLYIYGVIVSICRCEFNKWSLDLAIAKDQYGNALGKYVWNLVLIKKGSKHKFGNIDETMSSVIGKNKIDNTLTITGKFVDEVLNILDKNHSIKAIDLTEE